MSSPLHVITDRLWVVCFPYCYSAFEVSDYRNQLQDKTQMVTIFLVASSPCFSVRELILCIVQQKYNA